MLNPDLALGINLPLKAYHQNGDKKWRGSSESFRSCSCTPVQIFDLVVPRFAPGTKQSDPVLLLFVSRMVFPAY